jgi:hypothetical protein
MASRRRIGVPGRRRGKPPLREVGTAPAKSGFDCGEVVEGYVFRAMCKRRGVTASTASTI